MEAETSKKPGRDELWVAIAMCVLAAFCFSRGWAVAGVLLLLFSTPLDLVAKRLAMLRLRPLSPRLLSLRLLWPAAGLALLALGWFEARNGAGWGAMMAALSALAFAEAGRIERTDLVIGGSEWLFARRNAIMLAVPFAFLARWPVFLALLALYAGASFFIVQHIRHGLGHSPQR